MTTYEGWENRETWCLNLWLANDEGLYNMTRERAQELLDECEDELLDECEDDHETWNTPREEATYRLADWLKEWYDDFRGDVFRGEGTDTARTMVEDIGS